MATIRAFVTAALLIGAAGTLQAQHPQVRDGFWISFGLGYGSAGISCDQDLVAGLPCEEFERASGFTSYVRLGGTLNDRVLLGGDLSAWTKTSGGSTSTLGSMSATLVFYPAPANGFFLRGGAGFSVYTESNGSNATGTGAGIVAGAGYDIRVGRNISMTAFVDFMLGTVGDLEDGGTPVATGFSQNVIHAGLGVTFH